MTACAAIGWLNQEGIITICEGDVYGLITAMAMNYIGGKDAVLMDLTVIDDKDNTALFWHCGVGCKDMSYDGKLRLNNHFNPSPWVGGILTESAPVCECVFANTKATVARFTKEGDMLFLLSGDMDKPNKESHNGSRGWMSNIKLADNKINAADLRNTVILSEMQHHYVLTLEDIHKEMIELAAWYGCRPIETIEYKDYYTINIQ